MSSADVGDDVLGDDPNVNELQRRMAEMLGKEAAIYPFRNNVKCNCN
jgi:threonine aldolase